MLLMLVRSRLSPQSWINCEVEIAKLEIRFTFKSLFVLIKY